MAISQSLGLIEVVGLAAAIEVADAALKAANVRLLGYEKTDGFGYITIKLLGDVGAVQAAVNAGVVSASKVNRVVSQKVIPRPHRDLDKVVDTVLTVKDLRIEPISEGIPADVVPDQLVEVVLDDEEPTNLSDNIEATDEYEDDKSEAEKAQLESPQEIEEDGKDESEESQEYTEAQDEVREMRATCNICGDPNCPRVKGEPRTLCIHHKSE